MAIGKISGVMLQNNLARQGVNIAIDANLAYFDVNNRYVGINTQAPAYPLDLIGNAHLGNLYSLGNTITSDTGKINLGSIANVVITGGQANYIVYTDGAGNLSFGNLNTLSGLEGFTGNNITLGANTQGSLSNALTFSSSTSVTDAIADLNRLLGNITNNTGSIITTTTVYSTDLYGNVRTATQPYITSLPNTISMNALNVLGNTSIGGNLFVTGNINVVTGNITTINSAFFVGNTITGFGALYAGIPSGYSVLPNLVAQFSTNSNSYAQINAQNISSGQQATTDYVATANNGTDTIYYVDLGIASNTYNPALEFNSLGTSLYSNDAYLYTQGNVASTPGGNLVIGTATVNKAIRFISGGVGSANVVVTMNSPNTISSGSTTGAVVIAGDTGINGNINAAGNVTANNFTGNVVGNITGNVVGTLHGNVYADIITPYQTNITVFNSNTAIRIPVGDTVHRPTGSSGMIRFNTDTPALEYYDGTMWVPVTNTVVDQQITPDGVNSTFTLNQAATSVGVIVSINGVLQQPGSAYSVSGTQITFTQTPLTSDIVDVRFLGAAVTINTTLSEDLLVNGNVTLTGILSAPLTTKTSTSPGTAGEISWDANYIYVCTATNTWKRVALTGGVF